MVFIIIDIWHEQNSPLPVSIKSLSSSGDLIVPDRANIWPASQINAIPAEYNYAVCNQHMMHEPNRAF